MNDQAAEWEVLPGLPPYGPMAEGFSATGQGKHQEGFVVRFRLPGGENWVGNFQRDIEFGFDGVWRHPDPAYLVVIAGGMAYVIVPVNRRLEGQFGGGISAVVPVPENNWLIFTNGLWFWAINSEGIVWRSRRLSWEGVRRLNRDGTLLHGEADDGHEKWVAFELDLLTGNVVGGSYTGPPM